MIQLTCLDNVNDETQPMNYFDKDEKISTFKHLFSGDAIIVETPCDLYWNYNINNINIILILKWKYVTEI